MVKNKSDTGNRIYRILIVDDHPAVREGLVLRISRQANLEVCGEACDIVDALQLVNTSKPDVAIIDISLKTGNGIELIKRIKARDSSVRMVVWSMHDESLYAERALRAGAMGYVNKEEATSKIIEAIGHVLEDKVHVSPIIAGRLLNRAVGGRADAQPGSPVESLSDRELEVFRLFGTGLDTQEVATRLHISHKTVETYRGRIKEKLDIHNMTELVCRAVQWVMENQ